MPTVATERFESPPLDVPRPWAAAAHRIAEMIWLGELNTGDRLPPERELAVSLRLSRPTLRAALQALAGEGLLAILHGRSGGSIVVSDLVPEHLVNVGPPLERDDVSGVLEARRAVEPRLAQLAARHRTAGDLRTMEAVIERQEEGGSDWGVHLQLDTKFHLAIARACHNATALVLMKELQRRLLRVRFGPLRMPHDPDSIVDVHRRTLAAIARRDAGLLEAVMDEHLGWLERAWDRETARDRQAPEEATSLSGRNSLGQS